MEISQNGLDRCPHCNSEIWIRTSQTRKNPNRKYYKCSNVSCEKWIGFVDEFDINPDLFLSSAPATLKYLRIIYFI